MEYTTKDGNKIKKIGRAKKIYFTENDCYFLWNGTRQRFSEIPKLTYPIMYDYKDGKTGAIGGYITISNCYGVLVEILENSEQVQLWEEI